MTIQTYSDLDALPSSLRIYGASDYATMEPEPGKKEPDFTEHGVVGIDAIGDLWRRSFSMAACAGVSWGRSASVIPVTGPWLVRAGRASRWPPTPRR